MMSVLILTPRRDRGVCAGGMLAAWAAALLVSLAACGSGEPTSVRADRATLVRLPLVDADGNSAHCSEQVPGTCVVALDLVGGPALPVSGLPAYPWRKRSDSHYVVSPTKEEMGGETGDAAGGERERGEDVGSCTLCLRVPGAIRGRALHSLVRGLWRHPGGTDRYAIAVRTPAGRRAWVSLERSSSWRVLTLHWSEGALRGWRVLVGIRKAAEEGGNARVVVLDPVNRTVVEAADVFALLRHAEHRARGHLPDRREFGVVLGDDVPLGQWLPCVVRLQAAAKGTALLFWPTS